MSTKAQEEGDSLRRQMDLAREYARSHNLRLIDDYGLEDIGVSAFHGSNVKDGQLGRFLREVDEGKIARGSFLLVESQDRLSREGLDTALRLLLRLSDSGVNVVTLDDKRVYSDKVDLLSVITAAVVMTRANEESATKSRRLSAAWAQKRTEITSKKLTSRAPKWLSLAPDRKSFVKQDDRVSTVQRIFTMAFDGAGSDMIARTLNGEGVQPFGKGVGWHKSYIEKILRTRAVLGEFQPHTKSEGKRHVAGSVVPDYYPRIIDDEQFDAVQVARRSRRTSGGGRVGTNVPNLFSKIAKCGYCGSTMRYIDKGAPPKGGTYLVCSGALMGKPCKKVHWPYRAFEAAFLTVATEVNLEGVMGEANNRAADTALRLKTAAKSEKLVLLEVQRERVFGMTLEPSADMDFLKRKLDGVSAEIITLKADIAASRPVVKTETVTSGDAQLRSYIATLQDPATPSRADLRLKVTAKMRELIASLSLEADGDLPRIQSDRQKIISDLGGDEGAAAIADHIEDQARQAASETLTFRVTFVDGTTRLVRLDRKGTSVKAETWQNASGSYHVISDGKLVFADDLPRDALWKELVAEEKISETVFAGSAGG